MNEIRLNINTFAKARSFHEIICQFSGTFILHQDEFTVDATSQLGIFSLDLSRILLLEYETDTDGSTIREALQAFAV